MVSGDLLREARLRAGLTQAELAERAGRPQNVISRWERGEVLPSLETLRELIRSCELELTLSLASRDDSYRAHIEPRLQAPPTARVARAIRQARSAQTIRRNVLAGRRTRAG